MYTTLPLLETKPEVKKLVRVWSLFGHLVWCCWALTNIVESNLLKLKYAEQTACCLIKARARNVTNGFWLKLHTQSKRLFDWDSWMHYSRELLPPFSHHCLTLLEFSWLLFSSTIEQSRMPDRGCKYKEELSVQDLYKKVAFHLYHNFSKPDFLH